MSSSLDPLLARIKKTATELRLHLDSNAYSKSTHKPTDPLLFGGNLNAPIGFFGRDPGKDELLLWEPLIGASGKRVRNGLFRHLQAREAGSFEELRRVTSERAFYSNTVPFKQVGNKAWGPKITETFQPFIVELLVDFWKGDRMITLGTEAFHWFMIEQRQAELEMLEKHWESKDRYFKDVQVKLKSSATGKSKTIQVSPLPHPSPLNVTWFKKFPEMLEKRLQSAD